jgi:hypothetical protein
MRGLLLLIIGLLLSPASWGQKYDVDLGPVPAGFHWQALPEIKGAMLLPEGWYFKASGEKGSVTYFLTQEEIGESGEFQTGVSLHVVRKVKAKTTRAAPAYAEVLMMRAGYGRGQQQLEKSAAVEGRFHKHTVRFRESLPEGEVRLVYQLTLANAKTDTLYLLTFESPEKDWPAAWLLGDVMVKELVLDSGI